MLEACENVAEFPEDLAEDAVAVLVFVVVADVGLGGATSTHESQVVEAADRLLTSL